MRPSVIAALVLLGGLCASAASRWGLPASLAAAVLIALLAATATARLPGHRWMAPTAQVDTDEPLAERRLAELEAGMTSLRHDIRGALAPAMLVADRLVDSADQPTRHAAQVIVGAIERIRQRLEESRESVPPGG